MIAGMRPAPAKRPGRLASRIRVCRHRAARIVALVAVLTVVAACTAVRGTAVRSPNAGQPTSGSATQRITQPPSAGGGTSRSGPGSGAVPAKLRKFYTQRLEWGNCEPFATTSEDSVVYRGKKLQCARLTLPMDYAHPAGPTITIGVLRAKATGSKIGSAIFNPGGPGASGMSIVAQIARFDIDPTLAKRFDLVGFDPRGVASSKPSIACQSDAQRDKDRLKDWPGFMPSSTAQEVHAANEMSKTFVSDCLQSISDEGVDAKAFLAQVGTSNVAKDLDVLRGVLGDDKLTYVGWSYGTSIGTQYAEQFPTKVRAMLLDGAINPAIDSATDSLQQATSFQAAFDRFAQWCAGRQKCPWASADNADTRFQQLAQPLMDTPLSLTDGRALSFLDAVIGVADALYSDSQWPTLEKALWAFAHGHGEALMKLADEYYDRDSSGHYSNMLEAFTAICCMDSDRITDPKKVVALNKKLIKASPFQDNGEPAAAIFDTCAFWPVPPTMTPHTPDPQGLAPVLVVSTTHDPATPYRAGVHLAKDLNGRLLTVHGTRHTAYMLSGLTCVDTIGDDYLINLTVPKKGAHCPK
jgi:pimeloyl-ACP methyl ester carboxylesterase